MSDGKEFSVKAEHVVAVGDAWDGMTKEARYAILTIGCQPIGAIGPSCRWIEIPSAMRIELVHRTYLFRDFINEVLP